MADDAVSIQVIVARGAGAPVVLEDSTRAAGQAEVSSVARAGLACVVAAVAEICAHIKVVSGVAQTLIVGISVSIWAASQALINVRTGTGLAGAMARRAGLGGSVEVIWAGAGAGTVYRVAVAA